MDSGAKDLELRNIARRAVGRALAERGRSATPAAPPEGVLVTSEAPRPAEEQGAQPSRRSPLVTLECLRGIPDGGSLRVARDAQITPAAEEEIWRRGIRIGDRGGKSGRDAVRVAVGSDHGGFALKAEVLDWLAELGYPAQDLGTHDESSCDYPDFARAVAEAVAEGRADLGVCIDGAGIGSAMVANKVPGVLAAPAWNEASARNAREHNHARVLTLGAGMLSRSEAHKILRAFLSTRPGEGRHARRVEMIHAVERSHASRTR